MFTFRLDPLDKIDGILSDIDYDETTGKVKGAKGLLNIWLLRQNGTKEPNGDLVDKVALEWEKAFVEEIIKNEVKGLPDGLIFDALAERR